MTFTHGTGRRDTVEALLDAAAAVADIDDLESFGELDDRGVLDGFGLLDGDGPGAGAAPGVPRRSGPSGARPVRIPVRGTRRRTSWSWRVRWW